MQFRLRTLLIVLAVGPMVLAVGWFAISAWTELERTVQLQYQGTADESRRIDKGMPTFSEP
jgi:hypothetical protein